MRIADTYIRTRINTTTKELAAQALAEMGLTISDAVRLLMVRIADDHCLPFEVKKPNATTLEAMAELNAGKGKRSNSLDELITDLNADA